MALLYLASYLPKRSETFVSSEFLALEELGVELLPVSLHSPEKGLGSEALDRLAERVITIYPGGAMSLLLDAARACVRYLGVLPSFIALVLGDVLFCRESFGKRMRILVQASAALALAWRVRDRKIEGVHVQLAHAPTTVGMYAARILGVPFSFTGHAADLFRDSSLLIRKLQRAAFVCSISEWHRSWYQSLCPRSLDDYPLIRCGVKDLGINRINPDIKFRILGLGRLVPKKGFDLLLQAFAALRNEGIDGELILAGEGPEQEFLTELSRKLEITDHVRFLGAVDHASVPSLIAGSDVMVLPCRISQDGDKDGIPVSLMEAMMAGVCVVSGDLPTIRELVIPGMTGCLFTPGDVPELTSCLSDLARNPSMRQLLGDRGRIHVKEEFSSENNVNRFLRCLLNHRMIDPRSEIMS